MFAVRGKLFFTCPDQVSSSIFRFTTVLAYIIAYSENFPKNIFYIKSNLFEKRKSIAFFKKYQHLFTLIFFMIQQLFAAEFICDRISLHSVPYHVKHALNKCSRKKCT